MRLSFTADGKVIQGKDLEQHIERGVEQFAGKVGSVASDSFVVSRAIARGIIKGLGKSFNSNSSTMERRIAELEALLASKE